MSFQYTATLIISFNISSYGLITCQNVDESDICIANITTSWKMASGNIECSQNSTHSNCIINCLNEYSCGDDTIDEDLFILCPLNGNSCTINCINNRSCSGVSIESNNCSNVYVNIYGNNNTNMIIYAPGNNGILDLSLKSPIAVIKDSYLHTQPTTKNVSVHYNNGFESINNEIDASNMINGNLLIECNGSTINCNDNDIYCPISSLDDIKCDIICNSCNTMSVYAKQGTSDVNMKCMENDVNSCVSSVIYCNNNWSSMSQWSYDIDTDNWVLDGDCINIDTYTPSPLSNPITNSPTTETVDIFTMNSTSSDLPHNTSFTLIAALAAVFISILCCLCISSVCVILGYVHKNSKNSFNITSHVNSSTKSNKSNNNSSSLPTEPVPTEMSPNEFDQIWDKNLKPIISPLKTKTKTKKHQIKTKNNNKSENKEHKEDYNTSASISDTLDYNNNSKLVVYTQSSGQGTLQSDNDDDDNNNNNDNEEKKNLIDDIYDTSKDTDTTRTIDLESPGLVYNNFSDDNKSRSISTQNKSLKITPTAATNSWS